MAGSVMALAMAAMDGPFAWGTRDCSTTACDVFAALHGIDPMAPLRGRYASARGILRHMRKFGGFAEMVETMMAAAGLSPAPEAAGAIGLTHRGTAAGMGGQALAICAAPGVWMVKGENGVVMLPSVARVWNV